MKSIHALLCTILVALSTCTQAFSQSFPTVSLSCTTPKTTIFLSSSKGQRSASSSDEEAANEEAVALFNRAYAKKRRNKSIDESQLQNTFAVMSRVYGTENALGMVKTEPKILEFNPDNFGPSLNKFTEKFGNDKALGMLQRNPLMLVVKPEGYGSAEAAGNDVMTLSYIVAFTRPLGPLLLIAFFMLLALPLFEQVTGIPLREGFLPPIFKQLKFI